MTASNKLITLSAQNFCDSSGNLIANATVFFQPILPQSNTRTGYGMAGSSGGLVPATPVRAAVGSGSNAGKFTVSLPDVAFTRPKNIGFAVTAEDSATGAPIPLSGLGCIQPTSEITDDNSMWLATSVGVTSGNLDNYPPNLAPQLPVQAGPRGFDGLSAYQVWLSAGNSGTMLQFIQSLQGLPGPYASMGPAANVAANAAALASYPNTYNTQFLNGFTYLWTPGDYSGTGMIDGHWAIASTVSGSGPAVGAWIAQSPDGLVNVLAYGADPMGAADSTNAIQACADYCRYNNKGMRNPTGSYKISNSIRLIRDLKTGDRNHTVWFVDNTTAARNNFTLQTPMLNIGWSELELADPATYPNATGEQVAPHIDGLTLIGLGTFNQTTPFTGGGMRTADPSDLGFNGDGFLINNTGHNVLVTNCRAVHCMFGLLVNNEGAVMVRDCNFSQCYGNYGNLRGGGDIRFENVDATGGNFTSFWWSGDTSADDPRLGGLPGSLQGVTFKDCHFGFAPYGMYNPDGKSNAAMLGVKFVGDCAFESCGNKPVRMGTSTSSEVRHVNGVDWGNTSFGFSSNPLYQITNDPTNHPVQDYYVTMEDLQGDMNFFNSHWSFSSTTSGYWLKIASGGSADAHIYGLNPFMVDSPSAASYTIDPSLPYGKYFHVQGQGAEGTTVTPDVAHNGDGVTGYLVIADFTIDKRLDGATLATLRMSGFINVTNSFNDHVVCLAAVDGTLVQGSNFTETVFVQGESIFTLDFPFQLPGRAPRTGDWQVQVLMRNQGATAYGFFNRQGGGDRPRLQLEVFKF